MGLAADYYLTRPDDTNVLARARWQDFTGNWAQNTPDAPLKWSSDSLNCLICSNPKAPTDANVTLWLLPGTYRVPPYTVSDGTYGYVPTNRVLVLRSTEAANRAILQYEPLTGGYGELGGLFKGMWAQTAILQLICRDNFAQVDCLDLVLDANWPKWAHRTNEVGETTPMATMANATWVDGFKLSALYVKAAKGRISNVEILNCGANGPSPQSYWQEGFEAFPLMVDITSTDTVPPTGQTHPWVIEDTEVRQFHAEHGGYCTAIMINTLPPTNNPPASSRMAIVRRCQVYGTGAEIAYGSAHSAGITFSDNVAVGVKDGLNHDTPSSVGMKHMDITNNVFLDVALMANVGASLRGIGTWSDYQISGNAIRLKGVPLQQVYNDYAWQTNVIGTWTNYQPVTDTSLAVGCYATGYCAGVKLGGTTDIRFTNNWFSTRPFAGFFEPNPNTTDPNLARWTPLFVPTWDPSIPGWSVTNDWSTCRTNGNTLSPVAFDFGGNPTTLAAPADSRPALTTNPTDFVPGGWTGRVQPEYDDSNNDGRLELATVLEVGVTAPVLNGQQVQIKARLLNHMLPPTLGISVPQTAPIPPQSILHCAVGEGVNQGASITAAYNGTIATYTYSPASSVGRDLLVVWYDQPGGTDGQWDRDIDVWSAAEMLLGETVRFERMPDVANDLRIASGMLRIARPSALPTPLQVTLRPAASSLVARSATPAVDYQLVVYQNVVPFNNNQWTVSIPGGQRCLDVAVQPLPDTTPVREYEAAYFELVPNLPTYNVAPPAPWVTAYTNRLVQAAAINLWDGPKYVAKALNDHYEYNCGSSAMSVDAAMTATAEVDAVASLGEVASVDPHAEILPPDPNVEADDVPTRVEAASLEFPGADEFPVTSASAVEAPAEASADQWAATNGEETTQAVQLLESTCYQLPNLTYAYAVNHEAQPAVAGDAHYKGTYEFDWGGKWVSDYSDVLEVVGSAVASYSVLGIDNARNLVGNSVGAYYLPSAGTAEPLPALTAGRSASVAWLPPTSGRPVGSSTIVVNGTGYGRPTRWSKSGGTWQAEDLGSFYGTSDQTKPGQASGINDSNVAVGKSRYQVNGTNVLWAFRTHPTYGGNLLDNTNDHQLAFPPKPLADLPSALSSAAHAVNSVGAAVGSTDLWFRRYSWLPGTTGYVCEARAAYWPAGYGGRTNIAVLRPIEPVDPNPLYVAGRSEALGVNHGPSGDVVVGRSYITPTGTWRAFAALSPGQRVLNLNDPHLTYNQSGQVFMSAEDVNDNGWIVGNGTSRGYVLIPQALTTP